MQAEVNRLRIRRAPPILKLEVPQQTIIHCLWTICGEDTHAAGTVNLALDRLLATVARVVIHR